MAEPGLLRQPRRAHGGFDHGLDHHLAAVAWFRQRGVGVHQVGQQLLVQAPPVHADAHRLRVRDRDLHDLDEVGVAVLGAHVARVDAVLGQRRGRRRVLGQQQVAVVMEVPDQRDADAQPVQLLADDGHGLGGLVVVDGDAHQLAAGMRQLRHLDGGGIGVGGIGVRHRLHDDGMSGADEDAADVDGGGRTTLDHAFDATRSASIGHDGRMLAPIHPAPLPEGAGNVRPLPHPE